MQPEGSNDSVQQRCPQCGSDNPAGAMFCGNCGAQLRTSGFDRPSGPVQLDHAAHSPSAGGSAPPQDYQTAPQQSWQPPVSPAQPFQQPASPPPPPPINSPGAGLTPGYGEPTPPSEWQQPSDRGSHSQQAYVPPVYPQTINQQEFYPSHTAVNGNTSGMGEGYPLPPEASGWNWGGFVPFGLFGFINGNSTWGVVGILTYLFGFYLVYSIVIGATGKQMAWKGRRFDSVQQFEETMKAWNTWGLVLFIAGVVATIVFVIIYIAIIVAAISSEGLV